MTIIFFAYGRAKPWCPFDQERKKLCAISDKMLKNIDENGPLENNSVEKGD